MKFDLVVAIFPNLVANDYKSHVVINGLVTFWLISTNDGGWNLDVEGMSEAQTAYVFHFCDVA